MNKKANFFFVISSVSVFIVVAFSGFCFSEEAEPKIDFGSIEGTTYTHPYFGFSFQIPAEWQVQDNESQKRLLGLGKELISGEDKNLKAVLDASELNTLYLLTMFRYPLGAAVEFNPAFVSVAEKVSQFPGIQKGSDYLFHTRKLLESGQLKYTFPKEVYPENLGGVSFDVMESELDLKSILVKQKYYATIRKGYALGFVTSYHTDSENETLNGIMHSIRFKD